MTHVPGMHRFAESHVRVVSELLSRLCFRLTTVELASLFDTAVRIYQLPRSCDPQPFSESASALFERLFFASPCELLLDRMPQLLALPIVGEEGFATSVPERWPDPFRRMHWEEGPRLDTSYDRSAWAAPIARLIRIA